jgi:hypothetical protein
MSTRCTISYDNNHHLYQECFENDNVYLTLDGAGWQASIATASVDWRDGDSAKPSVSLQIDVTLWRKIVEGWLTSPWGQHPEDDHKKINFDFESTNAWLESLKKKKEGEANGE